MKIGNSQAVHFRKLLGTFKLLEVSRRVTWSDVTLCNLIPRPVLPDTTRYHPLLPGTTRY
eukprot:1315531-Amorphochlora_amoeboformis.AAC.1